MKKKHESILKMFGNFDFAIRFVYCKLGIISKAINKIMRWKLYSSDFDALQKKFDSMMALLEQEDIDFSGKVVLELGPGNSLLSAFNFFLNGAEKVILVDKFPRFYKGKKQKEFFREEISFLRRKFPDKDFHFLKDDSELKEDFLVFLTGDLLSMNLPKVDFIYSISVLEHVKNPRAVIARISELLNEGGFTYHHIDMRDHFNFSTPFLFYKYSDFAWEKLLTKEGLSYTNRWRLSDFETAFKGFGLNVFRDRKHQYSLNGVKLHRDISMKKNLDVGILDVLLKKKS